MYKHESIKMNDLKKMFFDYSFIKDPMSIKRILEKINSYSDKDKCEAMKHIICRMQKGEDMDCVFNDVIKAIDTRDPDLKRLTNLYIKIYTKGKPIRQLLCVNTLLKDLSDKSEEIKKASLEIIGFIGDDVVLTNYVNRLKKMTNESRDVQLSLIGTLGRLPESLYLGNILRSCAYSDDQQLSNKALENLSLQDVNSESVVLEDDEVLELLKRKENDLKACYFLIKIAYKRNINVDLSTLLKLLKKNYLPLFYFTASVLLKMDSANKQMVYDASLLYLKSTYEKTYHVLLFQEDLLNHVDYDNSTYLICEDEPFYIKAQKVKMLFYRLDDTSIYELTRHSKGISSEVILEFGLKKNFVIPGVFSIESNRIDILFNNYPFSNNYTYLIKNYLHKINPVDYDKTVIKKYLFLAGNICEDRPYALDSIEKIADSTLAYDIMKFYLSLLKRQIMTEEQLIETIRSLKKKDRLKEKAKVLLNIINFKGPFVLFDFAENQLIETSKIRPVKLDVKKEEEQTKTTLLSCKPYEEPFPSVSSIKDSLYFEEKGVQSPMPFINYTSEKEEWISKPTLSYSPSGDVIVDTKHLKGTLFLTKDEVKLEIDILEKPLRLICGMEITKELLIEKEETVCLKKIELPDIDKKYKMIISNAAFELLIDRNRLITPYKCSAEEHEKAFKSISTYKITDKLLDSSIHMIDDTSFAFRLLSKVVYGKNFCDQVVLKGDKDILEVF